MPLREPVVKEQFLMPAPVFMHEPRDLYVEAAVLRDLEQTTFAPPTNRIETGGRFLDAKSGMSDGVETQPMPRPFLHIDHQIGGLKLCDRDQESYSPSGRDNRS